MKSFKHAAGLLLSASAILAISTLVGISFNNVNYEKADAYAKANRTPDIDLKDPSESKIRSYYQSVNGKAGDNILIALKDRLQTGQEYYTYGDGNLEVSQIYEITDRDWVASPANKITGYYKTADKEGITAYKYHKGGETDEPYIHALYYNRDKPSTVKAHYSHSQTDQYGTQQEHIWPKSFGFKTHAPSHPSGDANIDLGKGGARGDLMHLWPGNGQVNGAAFHGDKYYGIVNKSDSTKYNETSTYKNSKGVLNVDVYTDMKTWGNYSGPSLTASELGDVFEPQDSDKGDIARAVFYMAARYNNAAGIVPGKNDHPIDYNNPNLKLTSDPALLKGQLQGDSTHDKPLYLGILSDLLAWNELDPPDEWEMHRNNLCYLNYTKNRNPFIDFPDWANYIWGNKQGQVLRPASDPLNAIPTEPVGPVVSVNSVTISPKKVTLDINQTQQLSYTISPSNATDQSVTYTSDNENVAKVNQNGLITAKSAGSAVITVKTNDGNKTDTCTVTVNKSTSPEGGGTDPNPNPGGGETTGEILSKTTDISKQGWAKGTTYNSLVDDPITYNAHKGTYYIDPAMEWRFYESKSSTFQITIKPGYELVSTTITFNSTNGGVFSYQGGTLTSGTKLTLSGTESPIFKPVAGSGKTNGQCKITSIVTEYKKLEPPQEVHVDTVTLDKVSATLNIGETLQLNHAITPTDAKNKNVTYTSNHPNIAEVTNNGLVTAISEGSATITVTTEDGNKTDICLITVNKKADTGGGDTGGGEQGGGGETPTPPDPVDPPTGDFKTTTMKAETPSIGKANFKAGDYYIAAKKSDNTEVYLNPTTITVSGGKITGVAYSDLEISAVTLTKKGTDDNNFDLSFMENGIKQYICLKPTTDIKKSQTPVDTWTLMFGIANIEHYGDDVNEDPNLIRLKTDQDTRSMLFNGTEFGMYSDTYKGRKGYTGVYLYEKLYVYDVLKSELSKMTCETMKNTQFNTKLKTLYGKLTADEIDALSRDVIVGSDKKSYNALQAYEYALGYYGTNNPSSILNDKAFTKTMIAIITILAGSTIAVATFIIIEHKRKTYRK